MAVVETAQQIIDRESVENGLITSYQWKTMGASFGSYLLDALDWQMISFALPLLIPLWGITPMQAGGIATWTMLGAVVGGWVFGITAEYLIRK